MSTHGISKSVLTDLSHMQHLKMQSEGQNNNMSDVTFDNILGPLENTLHLLGISVDN